MEVLGVHKAIIYKNLMAQMVVPDQAIDIFITDNEKHWLVWNKNTTFPIDCFLNLRICYDKRGDCFEETVMFPHPRNKKRLLEYLQDNPHDFGIWGAKEHQTHTLTSDYVSRIDLLTLIAMVNEQWNWSPEHHPTKVIIPQYGRYIKGNDAKKIKILDTRDYQTEFLF
jgi:hypothetical protein